MCPKTTKSYHDEGSNGETTEQLVYSRYLHLRDHARTVDVIAVWGRAPFTIATGGEGTSVIGNLVSANYFDLVGVSEFLGLFFRTFENRGQTTVLGRGEGYAIPTNVAITKLRTDIMAVPK